MPVLLIQFGGFMKLLHAIFILFVLLLCANANADTNSKTIMRYMGIYYLNLSAADIGRGIGGTSYYGDNSPGSFVNNPAKLSLLKGSYGSYLFSSDLDPKLKSYNLTTGFKNIGIMYSKSKNTTRFAVTTEDEFEWTGNTAECSFENKQVSLGVNFIGILDDFKITSPLSRHFVLASGFSYRNCTESIGEYDCDFNALDYSIQTMARDLLISGTDNIKLDLAFSYSAQNYNKTKASYKIDNDSDGFIDEDPYDLIDNDEDGHIDEDRKEAAFPMFYEQIRSYSACLKKALPDNYSPLPWHVSTNQFSFMLTHDIRNRVKSLGLEIGLYDFFYLRYGQIDLKHNSFLKNDRTWGIGINDNIYNKINIFYNTAYFDYNGSFCVHEFGVGYKF